MKNKIIAYSIIDSIREIYDQALTIKIRIGYNENIEETIDFAKEMEKKGVDAVFFHPRLHNQKFRSIAKWKYVSMLKKELRIPVIGNGDVKSPIDAVKIYQSYDCDGVMISRYSAVKPWIFKDIQNIVENQKQTIVNHQYIWIQFYEILINHYEYKEAFEKLRLWTRYFAQNFLFAHSLCKTVNVVKTIDELKDKTLSFIDDNKNLLIK